MHRQCTKGPGPEKPLVTGDGSSPGEEHRAPPCEFRRSELVAAFAEAGMPAIDGDTDEFLTTAFKRLCGESWRKLGPIASALKRRMEAGEENVNQTATISIDPGRPEEMRAECGQEEHMHVHPTGSSSTRASSAATSDSDEFIYPHRTLCKNFIESEMIDRALVAEIMMDEVNIDLPDQEPIEDVVKHLLLAAAWNMEPVGPRMRQLWQQFSAWVRAFDDGGPPRARLQRDTTPAPVRQAMSAAQTPPSLPDSVKIFGPHGPWITAEMPIALFEHELREEADLESATVANIATSIGSVGQLSPVLASWRDGAFLLVAGRHRLTASRRAGQDTIIAMITTETNTDLLRLAALDENLCRIHRTPGERDAAIAERDQILRKIGVLKVGRPARKTAAEKTVTGGHNSPPCRHRATAVERKAASRARKRTENVLPAVREAYRAGKLRPSQVDRIAALPRQEQMDALERELEAATAPKRTGRTASTKASAATTATQATKRAASKDADGDAVGTATAAPTSGVAQTIDALRAALAQLDARLAGLRERKGLRGRGLELVQDVGRFLREHELLDPDDGATS